MSKRRGADNTGAMASSDPDVDQLTKLLSQCLGRIDAEANSVLQNGEDVDFDTDNRLEGETNTFQELMDSMLAVEVESDETDLNNVVSRIAAACLQDIAVPIVFRQTLTSKSSIVPAPADLVTVVVQRAMVLTIAPLAPGDELHLTTRVENGWVLLEIESFGNHRDGNANERTQTLRQFVEELGGSCQVRCEADCLFLVIQLPQVIATDRSELL